MSLDILVRNYIESMKSGTELDEAIGLGKLLRHNNKLRSLVLKRHKSKKEIEELRKYTLENQLKNEDIIETARKYDCSEESGKYIGFLMPEERLIGLKTDFDKGINEGQILNLKVKGLNKYSKGFKGLLALTLGIIYTSLEGPKLIREDDLETIDNIKYFSLCTSNLGLIYGSGTMLWSKLFNNDENQSKELITKGPFAIHRNPFYFGMSIIMSSMFARTVGIEFFRFDNPNYLGIGIMTAGLAYSAKNLIDYMKIDENILEKQFGKKYIEYKSKTPRFFPNLFNLFRRK